VTHAPLQSPVAIAGASTSANVPLLGCRLWVAPGQATVFLSSSAAGLATYPLPIPPTLSLLGQSYCFQAAVLSPTTPNGFQLSAGLRCELGQ
jgi:hypothetical protein